MRISTIVIITLLILALYYYTAETFPVVQVAGKYILTFVKDAAVVRSLDEYRGEIKEDLRNIPRKIENLVDNIKKYFEKDS